MDIKLSTLNVLKNFSLINPSIAIKPGNVINTVSAQKSIMATAELEDDFPSGGAIYDLNRFLGVIGLFDRPQLDFADTSVKINGGNQSVTYRFADPEMIIKPAKDSINFPDSDVDINITYQKINNVLKAANVLQLPEIAVVGGENISLTALNSSDKGTDTYNEIIKSNDTGREFSFIFKVENLKLMNYDYNVKITSRGISQMKSMNNDGPRLTYWIAVEQNSTFQ